MHLFGGIAEWLCSGLQSRVRRFDSDSRLSFSHARMVKLVDTKDLKSFTLIRCAGSSPALGSFGDFNNIDCFVSHGG